MKLINYGIDRLKFSFSDYQLKDNQRFDADFEYSAESKGYTWYTSPLASIGFDKRSKYCVVELYALYFIGRHKGFCDIEKNVHEFLADYVEINSEIRLTRIDIYVDYEGTEVYPLLKGCYSGKSQMNIVEFKPEDDVLGSSYLQTKNKDNWLIRRYNKTAEIKANMTEYRYPAIYQKGVIRTEYVYEKATLKNLENRTVPNVLAYILKHLTQVNIQESIVVADKIRNEAIIGNVKYKMQKGSYTGVKVKKGIINRMVQLEKEYIALGGNQAEIITELFAKQ